MKFPYGICDFKEIITGNYFYCDRTDRIPLLERGKYSLFIRPRRFGKSLLLSMLFNYYDVAKADEFDALFGDLEIGKNPTPLHNQYFILQWDFSCIDPSGNEPEIKQALHDHVNACIKDFKVYYRDFLKMDIEVDSGNSLNSIHSLITSVRMSGRPVYLLIDEYDNFANEVMMGVQKRHQKRYEALVYEEGPLRTLFKVVKSSTSQSLFDRIFITGVSPVVMSDITSGYNIAKNIYVKAAFNDLCGFTHADAGKVIDSVAEEPVYNPTLTLYFIDAFYETRAYPRNMLDTNLAMDAGKLEYISQIPNGGQLLLNLMRNDHRVVITEPADRFGIREMVTDQSKDNTFMVSFLYYFGVLTISGLTEAGEVSLAVPNLVMKKLYVERLQFAFAGTRWSPSGSNESGGPR